MFAICACPIDGIVLAAWGAMKTLKRKLTLSAETVRSLTRDELARAGGGRVAIRDTQQYSCAGISCDPSCHAACVTLPG